MSDALHNLTMRLVRQEIEKRNPLDVEAIETLIRPRLTVTHTGEIVATDENGAPRIGKGPGLPNMSVAELLDEIASQRPSLFKTAPSAPGTASTPQRNPFQKGPDYSVTKQMLLLRTDPERAEHLAAEAGVRFGRI